jgi:hypothetical protein
MFRFSLKKSGKGINMKRAALGRKKDPHTSRGM